MTLVFAVGHSGCRYAAPARSAPDYARLTEIDLRSKARTNDARAQRELAFRAMEEGRDAEALDWLKKTLAADPSSSDAYNIRGMVRAGQKQFKQAEEDFRRASSLAPTKEGPHLNLGRMFVEQKRYQAAAAEFEAALGVDPKSLDAAILAGDAWRLYGSSINGKRFYRKALEIKPDEPRALAGLGIVLTNTGQFLEAQSQLSRARELGDNSTYTRGYLGLASALRAQSTVEAEQALLLLLSARKEGESGSHIWYGLGLAYLAKGDLRQAEQVLKVGLGRFPEVSGLHHTLGEVYALNGKPKESARERELSASLVRVREKEEAYLQDIASHPNELSGRLRYVEWLLSRGEAERAIAPLLEGLRRDRKDARLRRALRRAAALVRRPELLRELDR